MFGPNAPMLSSQGESCYEGVTLLARLGEKAGSFDVRRLCRAAQSVAYLDHSWGLQALFRLGLW
jgi:hypothetical protein